MLKNYMGEKAMLKSISPNLKGKLVDHFKEIDYARNMVYQIFIF